VPRLKIVFQQAVLHPVHLRGTFCTIVKFNKCVACTSTRRAGSVGRHICSYGKILLPAIGAAPCHKHEMDRPEQEANMKTPLIPVAVFTFLATAGFADGAVTEYVLGGVFCKSEQDIIAVFNDRRAGLSVEQSMAARNANAATCFVANKINYVISSPVRIGQVGSFGVKYTRYRATLVGMVIAGKITKLDQPLPTYFVRNPDEAFQDEMVELDI
jgi:hypothetical protein